MSKEIIKGLVSTVIPVFNRSKMLKDAVDSVLQQTYRPIEIIIVNDGSTDSTATVTDDLCKAYSNEIQVIHQNNSGPGLARESGLQMARGEFIQYLDSDDILFPKKFEMQVEGLRQNSSCGVSYGKTRHHQLPPDIPWKQTGEKIEFMFPAFLKQRCWSTPTPLYRREIIDQIGPWCGLRQEEDWEYDCRIAALRTRLHFCDVFIAEIGSDGSKSLSSQWKFNMALMKDRVKAHTLIFEHALRAGISSDVPEMQHFARELFMLSRQCGATGLTHESRKLFYLSKTASGMIRGNGWDFRTYALLARIFGWTKIAKIACFVDRFRI